MSTSYLWFLSTWWRTWRSVLWSHDEHWASETTASHNTSISLGTFSSLELLLGIIWGVEAAWHCDLMCVVSCSFKILPAIITEIWETADTKILRFLRLQEGTWGPQNISVSPACCTSEDPGILTVSNSRVVHSCWVQVLSWRVRNIVRLGAGITSFSLCVEKHPLRAANSRSPVLHRSLPDEQGKVLNVPQKYFPFNKWIFFFLRVSVLQENSQSKI